MKKRLILLTVILAVGMMTVSCKKKDKKDNKKQTQQQVENKDINTDIFNLGAQQTNGGNPNIKNLTPEEQQKLIDSQIDPVKVSEAITKAEAGDKEAIMSLSQLYFNLKDNEKVKKYLQMGVDRNYPEAIYNLAVILKQEGNTAEANKLMAKLPKNVVTTVTRGGRQQVQVRQLRMRPGAEEFNRGVELVRAKKYSQAKVEFEKAYNKGIKDADVRIAMLNKEMKNYPEAIKWLKKASNRGVKGTDVEIGAILYDNGRQEESRPYLMKSYKSGNKGLAGAIAATYQKEKNMSEALKWYKIAAKNGDKNAKEIVSQLESGGKVVETTKRGVKLFLNGGESQNESLTKQTIKEFSKENKETNKSKEEATPKSSVIVKEEVKSNNNNTQAKSEIKEHKEVNVDEVLKNKAAEYNK